MMIDEKILIEKIKDHAEKVGGSVSKGAVRSGYLLAHEHIIDIIDILSKQNKRKRKGISAPEIPHLHMAKLREWIPCSERLPDSQKDYLVVVKLKYIWEKEWEYHTDVAVYRMDGIEGYIGNWDTFNDWDEGQEIHITHWMPLPEPPKAKDDFNGY